MHVDSHTKITDVINQWPLIYLLQQSINFSICRWRYSQYVYFNWNTFTSILIHVTMTSHSHNVFTISLSPLFGGFHWCGGEGLAIQYFIDTDQDFP